MGVVPWKRCTSQRCYRLGGGSDFNRTAPVGTTFVATANLDGVSIGKAPPALP